MGVMPPMIHSAQARESAGLTLKAAAKRARISVAYLRRIEKSGAAPYVLAVRLSHIYNCKIDVFLQGQPERPTRRRTAPQPSGGTKPRT